MWRIRIARRLTLTWVLFGLFPIWSARGQGTQPATKPDVVAKYIGALQKKDFKTVIDLTSFYQEQVANIKAQNPRVLWPKLLGEYYDSKSTVFSQQAGYWQNYGESLGGMVGDPTQAIRALQSLLPASCKWKITESRTDRVQDSIAFGPYERTRAYVTVDYPSPADAPIAGQQLLKETILEFTVNAKSQLVMAAAKVSQADAYWSGGPEVRVAMAKRFFGAGLWDAAISQLEPLKSQNKLSAEGLGLLASAYFQHVTKQCFAEAPLHLGGSRVLQFNGDSQCMTDIKEALTLKPTLRTDWVNTVLSAVNVSLQAGELESASSLVKMASEFAAEVHSLDAAVGKLQREVAVQYLHRAIYTYAHQGNGDNPFTRGQVHNALELFPELIRTGTALEVVRECMNEAASGKTKGDPSSDMYFFGILDFMKKFGILIPSQESGEFLQWANQTSSPSKWRKEVGGLVSAGAASSEVATASTPTPASPSSASGPSTPQPATGSTACGDYDGCFSGGMNAYKTSDWQNAITDFQASANQHPDSGEPWAWLGKAYLGAGRAQDAPGAWDRALQLGAALTLSACHGRGMRPCETGDLYLSLKEISFTVDGEKLFSQAPSQVGLSGSSHSVIKVKASFGLQVNNKNYSFDFFPVGVSCGAGSFLHCPENGVGQQLAISDYVSRTIPKLASGTFSQSSQPAASPGGASSIQSGNAANPARTVEGTIDLIGTTVLGGGDMFTLILTPPNYKPRDRQPMFAVDAATRWKCNPGDTVRITYKDPPAEANSWKGTAAELTGVVVSLVVLKPAH